MSYKNKIYVAFHYGELGNMRDGEKSYYHLLEGWREHKNIDFNFYNAHDINKIKTTSNDDTIERALTERLKDTKLMLLLVGDETKKRKWVKWELEEAKKRNIPVIAIETNTDIEMEIGRVPSEIFTYKFAYTTFELELIKKALNEWHDRHPNVQNGKYVHYK